MIGFVFVSESEAKMLLKKVVSGKDLKGCMFIVIHLTFMTAHLHTS